MRLQLRTHSLAASVILGALIGSSGIRDVEVGGARFLLLECLLFLVLLVSVFRTLLKGDTHFRVQEVVVLLSLGSWVGVSSFYAWLADPNFRPGLFLLFAARIAVGAVLLLTSMRLVERLYPMRRSLPAIITVSCSILIISMIMKWGDFSWTRRFHGSFSDPNYNASFLLVLAFFLLAAQVEARTRLLRLVLLVFWVLCVGAIVLTFSRSGWVALGVGTMLFCFGFRRGAAPKAVRRLGMVMVITLGVLSSAGYSLMQVDLGLSPSEILLRWGGNRFTLETPRLSLWRAGLELAVSSPLTGIGLGQSNERIMDFSPDLRARVGSEFNTVEHNTLLEIANAGGVPLLLLLWVFAGVPFLRLLRMAWSDGAVRTELGPALSAALVATAGAYIIMALTLNLFTARHTFLLAGIYYGLWNAAGRTPLRYV